MGYLVLVLVGVSSLLLGLAAGVSVCYIYAYQPLLADYRDLVALLADMKKQGFVRNYAFEQAVKPDPSADIREY